MVEKVIGEEGNWWKERRKIVGESGGDREGEGNSQKGEFFLRK